MAFGLRLLLYLVLSVPFAILSWVFVDFAQNVAHSLPLARFSGPGDLVRLGLSLVVFLPWIIGVAAVAAFEANQSRSLGLTAIATAVFWGAAAFFSSGFWGAFSGMGHAGRIGSDALPYVFTRQLHDWLTHVPMFGSHAFSFPGYWQIHGLLAPALILSMIMIVVFAAATLLVLVQRRIA